MGADPAGCGKIIVGHGFTVNKICHKIYNHIVKQDFSRLIFPDIVKNVNRFGSPNDDVGLFTDFALDRGLQAFTRFDAVTRNGSFPF